MVAFVFFMFVVAGCGLLLYSLSVLSPIFKAGPGVDAGRALFDTSRGEREARKTFDVLTMALAQSSTDAEFKACFWRLLRPCSDLQIQNSWMLLLREFRDYRSPGDHADPLRRCAKRYVCTILRRYRMPLENEPVAISHVDARAATESLREDA